MSILRYISFPSNLDGVHVSYIKKREEDEFCINDNPSECIHFPNTSFIESQISFLDKENATFNNCFNNSYIYRFYLEVVDCYSEQIKEISQRYMKKEAIEGCLDEKTRAKRNQEIKVYWNKSTILYNQTLYKFLNENLKIGEFVEIYTTWIQGMCYDFKPPTSEETIKLQDLLKIISHAETIGHDERTKMTIIKTE